MSYVNSAEGETYFKVVYWGPALSGKTTNLVQLHRAATPDHRADLLQLQTGDGARFDFLSILAGEDAQHRVRLHLYSVPGQLLSQSTRRVILGGADAVVFVADSQEARRDANQESMEDLKECLRICGMAKARIGTFVQLNKRDCQDAMAEEDMLAGFNQNGFGRQSASAFRGAGIWETLQQVCSALRPGMDARLLEEPLIQESGLS